MAKILITGREGQLGYELARTFATLGDIKALSRAELDLSNLGQIEDVLLKEKPNIILNAAAYTAVDKAESEKDLNLKINANAVGILGEVAKKINAVVVHYSTDYVFNGQSKVPYKETDVPAPQSEYGVAKLLGENELSQSGANYFTFRTSWVYGARGKNFMLTMLKLAREREELGVVADQHGSPTWVRSIAEATAQVLAQARGDYSNFFKEKKGLYHLTCAGQTTWYNFAESIFKLDPKKHEQILRNLKAIRTLDYKTPAQRPAYSVLDNSLFEKTFCLKMPVWDDALKLALQV